MPGIARQNDTHMGVCGHGVPYCCPHAVTGIIASGSPTNLTDGRQTARVTDPLIHNCPHCDAVHVASGSSYVFTDTLSTARLGDMVQYSGGSGVIVSASVTNFAD